MSDPAVPPNDAPTPPAEVPAGVSADAPQDVAAAAMPMEILAPAEAEATPLDAAVGQLPAEASAPVEAPAPTPPGMSPAACGARLAELFPALFGTEGPPKPIKLRIHVDLQARAPGVFSRRVLGPFFARYTTSNAYLKVLSTATERFDLDGQPAGEVTEEHRSAAVAELARRREIAIAKRAAERGTGRAGAQGRAGAPAGETAERAGGERSRPERGPRRDGQHEGQRHGQRAGERGSDRGAHRGAGRDDRPPRPPRDGRPDRRRDDGPRGSAGRPPRADRPDRRPDARPAQRPAPAAEAPEPQDPAQRERALLLRQFESSPLTKANFCVLKRISEADLDAQLDVARRERAERHKR
ncbi:ProQ/FINO family protein [Rubrivivax albus]|uniref:Prop effector ProQ n=1 Tax=Rubrivivax albus TaxID=2499835 RepID=A0A437JYM6_9BURK|nr:ProQ/FinO family protein [Rubrivivax albus]RVT52708.1 prop effector ProQ [Rubrivivax albus]